jgi:hypothetical protein
MNTNMLGAILLLTCVTSSLAGIKCVGGDFDLTSYENLRTYGPLHQEPKPGAIFVRIVLKITNISKYPYVAYCTDARLEDSSGRQYSYAGFGSPINDVTIQPGLSEEAEMVFMVPSGDVGVPMKLMLPNGYERSEYGTRNTLTAHLPLRSTIVDN